MVSITKGAAAAAAAGTTFVAKTADETVTSSTTVQDDDHLTFTMAADKHYAISGCLLVDSGTTPDFKYTLDLAGTSTSDIHTTYLNVGGGSVNYERQQNEEEAVVGSGAGTPVLSAIFTGIALADGSGGALTLQWAQNTSDGGATKLLTGSWISYTLLN